MDSDDEARRKKADYMRKWRKENPEAARAINQRRDAKLKEDTERSAKYRDRHNAWKRERYVTNREDVRRNQRNSYLRTKYGIEPEEYDRMLENQGGTCAICGSVPVGAKRYLCVDHCHVTGRVRGLLCDRCNRAIGLLGDEAEVVRKAAAYLNR